MHWEKEIRVRITIRRVVIAVLAASTVANLMIVGAVYGADPAPPAPTETSVSGTTFSASTFSVPATTVMETSVPALTQILAIALTDTPTITATDIFTPTQMSTDPVGWKLCIRKFYWPTYRVQYGDTLFQLAAATGSTVEELSSANCLKSSRIYTGQ